eukprot:scaffold10.g2464.t1
MSEYESGSEQSEREALSNPDVVTKYKAAAKITNNALAAVAAAVKPGAKVVDLCDLGDKFINDAVSKEFKGKDIEKGIAVPTCVSINHCIGHFSPEADNTTEVAAGDVVKIDLGCHIDGYIAQAAHTVVAGGDAGAPVTGRAADAIQAAATAFEAAARLIRPGKKVGDVAGPLNKIAEAYGCTMVEGVLTHQMKRFIIDAEKSVLNRPSPEQKVEDAEFEEGEVYAIDIVVSTGEGKAKVLDEKSTTVYKRALDMQYQLKIKASREVYSEILKKYPTCLFSIRGLDSKTSRYGIRECVNHGLLHPYPVLFEKEGALVAQIKGTVLLMPSGSSDRVTAAPLQARAAALQSDKSVEDEEVKALLAQSLKAKKKKKKGDKAEPAAAEPAAA